MEPARAPCGMAPAFFAQAPPYEQHTPSIRRIGHSLVCGDEVARTREAVLQLEEVSGTCSLQLWVQGWLLRLSGLADLILIVLLLWVWFTRSRVTSVAPPLPEALCDQDRVASGSLISGVPSEASLGSESSTTTPLRPTSARPTRPSDLKKWQTSP